MCEECAKFEAYIREHKKAVDQNTLSKQSPEKTTTSTSLKFNISTYDFNSIEGIRAIPILKPDKNNLDLPYDERIEYILQGKATEYRKSGNMDLAIECLKKANEIMPNTYFCYSKKEYLRLVDYLKMSGRNDEADMEIEKIHTMFGNDYLRKADRIRIFQDILNTARSLGTDLLEMNYQAECCPECAKYQGRVFSISGKDTRFPKLPEQFFKTGTLHDGCKHSLHVFNYSPNVQLCHAIIDDSEKGYHLDYVDAIKYSNRPFVDDRSKYEKEYYQFKVMCEEYEKTRGTAAQYYSAKEFDKSESAYIDLTILFNMLFPMWKKFDQRLPYGDTPYKRLAMIREKKGDYEGAALACIQQLRLGLMDDGTKGGMCGRLARMVKKGNLIENAPKAMKEISKYIDL